MQQPNAAAYLGSRKLRSLLVEPDSQTRQTIELAMSVRGHEVVDCSDAPSALTTFHDNLFHLIIISSGLPDGGALRLCRDIRALPGGDETTIVILSAAPSEDDRVAATEAGADDFIGWTAEDERLSDHLDRVERTARNRPQPGQTMLYGSSERFMVINPDGSIREAAPVAERLLGFPPDAILGVNAFSFFHPDDAPQLLSIVTGAFTQPGRTRAVEVRVRRDGDSWQTIAISAFNKTSDPQLQGVVIDLRGPDARVGIDDQGTRAAMHDHLTDLPNRGLFIDRVDHAVVRSARRQQPVVVMAIDFNDLATDDGQARAEFDDCLIIAVAQRLRSCLRSSDSASRLGHDLFGILLEEMLTSDDASIVANRIVRAMSVPFVTGGTELTLMPHIGIAVSSPSRQRAVDLLRDASIARAWARVQGSGSYVTFDPSMQPPDDEPITNEFSEPAGTTVVNGLDDRLGELNQRIASLEQTIARIAPAID